MSICAKSCPKWPLCPTGHCVQHPPIELNYPFCSLLGCACYGQLVRGRLVLREQCLDVFDGQRGGASNGPQHGIVDDESVLPPHPRGRVPRLRRRPPAGAVVFHVTADQGALDLFVTGASGYIGSAVTRALVKRGHRVRGLARSAHAAEVVRAAGGTPVEASLTDVAVLAAVVARGDGVVHTAADPGPQRAAIDEAAVTAMLASMEGGVFVTTSGAPRARSSRVPVVESDVAPLGGPLDWLAHAEERVLAARSVRGVVVRPPIVYGDGGGPVARMVQGASTGAAYVIDGGENRWSTVHVRDLADAYVLLAESEARGVFHAAELEPEPMVGIWTAIAEAVSVPVRHRSLSEANEANGPLAAFLAMDGCGPRRDPAAGAWLASRQRRGRRRHSWRTGQRQRTASSAPA